MTKLIDPIVGDVILTRSEIKKLILDKLVSYGPATCPTRYSEFLKEHGSEMGRHYASEIKRHYR